MLKIGKSLMNWDAFWGNNRLSNLDLKSRKSEKKKQKKLLKNYFHKRC